MSNSSHSTSSEEPKESQPDGRSIVNLNLHDLSLEMCKELILTRAYICRRPLGVLPLAWDYMSHSAVLFDAHTRQQAEYIQQHPTEKPEPTAQFMFERYGDEKDPESGMLTPQLVIRKVDIGKPFLLWYQAPHQKSEEGTGSPARYQLDKRSYDCFKLDGYRWTKQRRGNAVQLNIDQLQELARKHGKNSYDLAENCCHDAQENILNDLDVERSELRAVTRLTNQLRPLVSTVSGASNSVQTVSSESSTSDN